jgi:hypothetical protein
MDLGLKVDLRGFRTGMKDVFKKQLPFARAQALTMTAGEVGLAWKDVMREGLDRPTPFTLNAVGVAGARKTRLIARVYLKDIAAAYIEPFVKGGPHFLGAKKALLTPKGVATNQYGNLPRGKIASLKGKPGVYVGAIRLRSGQTVGGVWQRGRATAKAAGPSSLKLLVRFSDPQPVKQRLPFYARTEAVVLRTYPDNFAKAFNHAVATAR